MTMMYGHVKDSYYKSRWKEYLITECSAIARSEYVQSRTTRCYRKYKYYLLCQQFYSWNDVKVLGTIEFSSKKQLSVFFRTFSSFFVKRVEEIAKHNSESDTKETAPLDVSHIEIIEFVKATAEQLNFSERKKTQILLQMTKTL